MEDIFTGGNFLVGYFREEIFQGRAFFPEAFYWTPMNSYLILLIKINFKSETVYFTFAFQETLSEPWNVLMNKKKLWLLGAYTTLEWQFQILKRVILEGPEKKIKEFRKRN